MSETNLYQDSYTGKVERLTVEQAEVFPHRLRQVPEGTKPFLPGMFRPGPLEAGNLPEPVTEQQEQAQAELDAVLEDNDPRTKAAREAKAAVEAADKAAAKAAAEIKE